MNNKTYLYDLYQKAKNDKEFKNVRFSKNVNFPIDTPLYKGMYFERLSFTFKNERFEVYLSGLVVICKIANHKRYEQSTIHSLKNFRLFKMGLSNWHKYLKDDFYN